MKWFDKLQGCDNDLAISFDEHSHDRNKVSRLKVGFESDRTIDNHLKRLLLELGIGRG